MNKSTQSHDAFVDHARQRHDYTSFRLTAAELGRLVFICICVTPAIRYCIYISTARRCSCTVFAMTPCPSVSASVCRRSKSCQNG